MARKRISESDLLDFQARTAELSRAVESKYDELDRLKQAEPVPVREMGLLILPDAAQGTSSLQKFAARIKKAGLAAELVDVMGYVPVDRFDRTPEWQRRLQQAQTGYLLLKQGARKICVVGAGSSCALAALIAEQYPVDALVTVGAGLGGMWGRTGKRGSPRISRIARNNLFSIVCPVLSVAPQGISPAFTAETRSRDARKMELPAGRVESLWEECESALVQAICEFLAEV